MLHYIHLPLNEWVGPIAGVYLDTEAVKECMRNAHEIFETMPIYGM